MSCAEVPHAQKGSPICRSPPGPIKAFVGGSHLHLRLKERNTGSEQSWRLFDVQPLLSSRQTGTKAQN